MSVPGGQPRGVVLINGEPFFLANNQAGAPMWQPQMVATQEGDPTRPQRFRWADWSRGMGDSRGAFKGAIESCLNAWTGSLGRFMPGPKIHTISTSHDIPITCIVPVTAPANRVISFGGRYGKEIDPSAHTVSTTKDFGAGATAVGAQLFIDQLAIAMGESTQFQRRNASGTYSASTVSTSGSNDYRYANSFGLSIEGDLVRGRSYFWSKCSAADFYGTNGNWTIEYDIGNRARKITQVGAFEGWDFVLKEEGLYTYRQEDSREGNVLPDMEAFASANNKRWGIWGNRLFVCTIAGLYRYLKQGLGRPVSIEESPVNESFLRTTRPTAFCGFGEWAYEARYDDATTTTYILMLRNARDGDAHLGSPFTPVSIIDSFTGKCLAITVPSIVTDVPEVWYGRDTDVAWFKVGLDGQPIEFRDSGTATVTFSPTDCGSPFTVKYARRLQVIARNLGSTKTAQFKAGWDGGSLSNVGAALTAVTASFAEVFFTLATGDHGRVIQVACDLTNDSTTVPPVIRDVVLEYDERPEMVPGGVMVLALEDFGEREGYASQLTAAGQRQFIEALLDGSPVTFVDPDGESYTAGLSIYSGETREHNDGQLGPQPNVQVTVRRLDYVAV